MNCYIDDWNRFNEGLLTKEAFYRKLNDEQITNIVHFECKNMGDYHDLY